MAGPPPTVPQEVALARHAVDLDDDGHVGIETAVTAETDTTLVYSPDGTGGVVARAEATGAGDFLTVDNGGGDTIDLHGSTGVGATETIDPANGNVHKLLLNANCVVTLAAPVGSDAATIEGWFKEDGTGGWTLSFAAAGGGSFAWDGTTPTLPTTAGTTFRIIFQRNPGTTNDWLGVFIGGSGPDLSGIDFLVGTASGLLSGEIVAGTTPGGELGGTWPSPTVDPTHSGSSHAATQAAAEATAAAALAAHVAAGGGGASEHAHVVEETHLSDGSTVTWTLDQAYEPGSVIAWNITTIARLLVTEVLPDKATVSAAGTTVDKIVFDYAATLGA